MAQPATRFASPFEIETPPGAEGWQQLYSYSLPFSEARRDYEDSVFWFRDGIHWHSVITPFDATFVQFALSSLGQYNSRHYMVPPALGVDYRVLNGWVYLTPVPVADPAEIPDRVPHFLERAGYYYGHWDELYASWIDKARDVIARLEAIEFHPLPDMVPLEVVTSGVGKSNMYDLVHSYHELIDIALELWQYHFEFLNLGYAAYLDYFMFCKTVFPDIPDLSIAKMVAGIDVDLFRPDQELRKLARSAVELGVDDVLEQGTVDEALASVAALPGGATWIAQFEAAKYPWFNYSNGSGFYHSDAVWAERLDIPFAFLRGYIRKLQAGETIDTPTAEVVAERDRVAGEYLELLDGDDRTNFETKLGLVPDRVPLRREPQLLRGALGPQRVLAQDARAVLGVLQGGLLGPSSTTSSCCAGRRSTTRCGTWSATGRPGLPPPAPCTGRPRSPVARASSRPAPRGARRRPSASRPTS